MSDTADRAWLAGLVERTKGREPQPWEANIRRLLTLAVEQEREIAALKAALEQPPLELLDMWMKNELSDYAMVLDHCTRIYAHFSEGRISKPNTYPEEVIEVAEELESDRTNESLRELEEQIAALQRERDEEPTKARVIQQRDNAQAALARVTAERDRVIQMAKNVDEVIVDQSIAWNGLKRAELSAYLKSVIAAVEPPQAPEET